MSTILERTINLILCFCKKNTLLVLVVYLIVFLTVLVNTCNAQSIIFDGSDYEIKMFENSSASSKTKTDQTKVTTNSATKKINPNNNSNITKKINSNKNNSATEKINPSDNNKTFVQFIDAKNESSLIQESIKQTQSDNFNEDQINDGTKPATFFSTQTLIAGKKSYSPILKETGFVKKTAGISLTSNTNTKGKSYRKDSSLTVFRPKANKNVSESPLNYKSSNLGYSNPVSDEKEISTEVMESKSISFLPKTGMMIRCNESDSDEWIINFSEISNFQMVTKKCLSPENNLLNIATFEDIPSTQNFSPKIKPNEFVKLRNNPAYEQAFNYYGSMYGVSPKILSLIAYQESRFNPSAISPKGAIGLMQFMPATAKRFGVNPYNPISSIEGAAKYISYLLKLFNGNIYSVIAAYNAGEAAVIAYLLGKTIKVGNKVINPNKIKTQHGIPPYRETINYVTSILKML